MTQVLRTLVQKLPHLAHKLGEDIPTLVFVAGAEVVSEAHPVQLEPVHIVSFGELPH